MSEVKDGRVASQPDYSAEPKLARDLGPSGEYSSRGPAPIARLILFFDQQAVVMCDARCDKAWGISSRPKVQCSDDPDDTAYLADGELNWAPDDPGTYEGAHGKPQHPDERLNKWCVRECERSAMSRCGKANETITTPDFSKRSFNMPWLHKGEDASATEAGTAETRSGSVHEGATGEAGDARP